MNSSNNTRVEVTSGSQTQVVDGFRTVQTRLRTLVLTLENLSKDEKQEKDKKNFKSTSKRESFFRELKQMRNDVTSYVNDIERHLQTIRPKNIDDVDYIDQAQSYLLLVQLTTDILKKLTQLFTEIFDRFSDYMDQLWNYMTDHDHAQTRRVTREFNDFFYEKTSNSNKLFNDIQQLVDDIDRAGRN